MSHDRKIKKTVQAIAEWKQEATGENSSSFFVTPVVKTILSGTRRYVVGRKGSGKSAIVNYIDGLEESDLFSACLNFSDFPINDLYSMSDKGYPSGSQHITFWKYTILCGVVKKFAENERIAWATRRHVKKIFFPKGLRSLSKTISHWNSLEFGGTILGTGGNAKLGKEFTKAEISMRNKVEMLENFILEHIDTSKYFVLFDALDEGYEQMQNFESREKYIGLITSLFKAVESIRNDFSKTNAKIFPVVFIRDDIFGMLKDSNRTKWDDDIVGLYWNPENLKKMICHRMKIDGNWGNVSDSFVWKQVISRNAVRKRRNNKITHRAIWKYALDYSHHRPRDLIVFMQKAARISLLKERNKKNIMPSDFRNAKPAFSEYMLTQLEDELYGVIPEIRELLKKFSKNGRRRYEFNDIQEICKDDKFSKCRFASSAETLIEILYHFSFLGNLNPFHKRTPKSEMVIFRYQQPDKGINLYKPLILHRGFCEALRL